MLAHAVVSGSSHETNIDSALLPPRQPIGCFLFGANMKSMNLFAQIAKIDESKHEVWGVATAETVDKEGEIFDYDSSKPYFKLWSEEISKATDGKSLGNVREMHEPSAVGKLVAIAFDDDLKQIRVGARIVDSVAWRNAVSACTPVSPSAALTSKHGKMANMFALPPTPSR